MAQKASCWSMYEVLSFKSIPKINIQQHATEQKTYTYITPGRIEDKYHTIYIYSWLSFVTKDQIWESPNFWLVHPAYRKGMCMAYCETQREAIQLYICSDWLSPGVFTQGYATGVNILL